MSCVSAALETEEYLADCMSYPLLVLLEASARSQGVPLVFLIDVVHSLVGSLLNKHLHVHLGQYRSMSRCWTVGTAAPGFGKSPATKPIVQGHWAQSNTENADAKNSC